MFQDKVAIVTGAATGLGETIAEGMFARGAITVLADVNVDGVRAVAERLDPTGRRTLAVETDVSDPRSVEAMVAITVKRFGKLHLAVNNAGLIGKHGVPLAETSVDDWNRLIAVDLGGVFLGMKYQIPAMLAGGEGGAIVNMSSGAGATGVAGMAPYVAAKHGIVGLTKVAALDYADRGIRVTAVGPGYIDTPEMRKAPASDRERMAASHPVGRFGTRKEVADLVAFLLSDEARFITGSFHSIDGGLGAG